MKQTITYHYADLERLIDTDLKTKGLIRVKGNEKRVSWEYEVTPVPPAGAIAGAFGASASIGGASSIANAGTSIAAVPHRKQYTIAGAAKILKLPYYVVQRAIAQGKLLTTVVADRAQRGSKYQISQTALDAFKNRVKK
jgi:hypothetical protein